MSMDDIHDRAQALERGLEQFIARLKTSFLDVERSHQAVTPLWDDSMSRDYQRSWQPLEESMKDFIQRVSPQYVDTLLERLRHLKAYLYGS
jgi:hypothetical protein